MPTHIPKENAVGIYFTFNVFKALGEYMAKSSPEKTEGLCLLGQIMGGLWKGLVLQGRVSLCRMGKVLMRKVEEHSCSSQICVFSG